MSVLVLDIDHFKNVNDVHGHLAGDLVLQGVSRVLSSASRHADLVCRWGGEEFVIALPQTERQGALVAAERIRASIERAPHHLPDGKIINATMSIGVASASAPWTMDKLVGDADTALYEAKRCGRNRVCLAAG